MSTNRVAYFYAQDIGKFYYYKDHPMKPKRISMVHSLIESYDIYSKLDVYDCRHATRPELLQFHNPQYVNYLQNFVSKEIVSSGNQFIQGIDLALHQDQATRRRNMADSRLKAQFCMNYTGDCPGFAGLYEFCQLSCGGSIDSAALLITGGADIAINWGGGLHHAKKCEASGFCYANDIVLGILEFLKYYPRVVYVDVDVHHGDGVEEAFFLTDRVMTVSFHQYGEDFFPGTGGLDSIGEGKGRGYSINVPLKTGIDDDTYQDLFDFVMDQVMSKYRPGAIVLQLGADSLASDYLGGFNLTLRGHGHCVKQCMSYGVPLMMLGGGGYTVNNVARCWLYQTGLALGRQIDGPIPRTDRFYECYAPDTRLHVPVKAVKNNNSPQYVHQLKERISQLLRSVECSPGVQFHHVPGTGDMERITPVAKWDEKMDK